jgi:hypothetical protein
MMLREESKPTIVDIGVCVVVSFCRSATLRECLRQQGTDVCVGDGMT